MVYLAHKFLYNIIFTIIVSAYFYSDNLFVILFSLILSFCAYRFSLVFSFAILDFIHQIFFSFFGRNINSFDIWLFFTHISETFETLGSISTIILFPLFKLSIFCIIIYSIRDKIIVSYRVSIVLLISFIYIFPLSANITSFCYEIAKLVTTLHTKYSSLKLSHTNTTPIKQTNTNIILIFGESLREDIFANSPFYATYSTKSNFYYQKAISLGTNTDVVLPLFINATNDTQSISDEKNLFKLAKKANYTTHFYSTQYDKALQYIKPYLSIDNIDYYDNGNKDSLDSFLLDKIDSIDFDKKTFAILQMYGTHSPYTRYPKEYKQNIPKDNTLNETIQSDYKNSFLYTQYILDKIISIISTKVHKETIIIFVSDHGELIHNEYGHNKFDKAIYTVPSFVYTINSKFEYKQNTIYQLDLVNIILQHLGYNTIDITKPYKVNGTMISGEDGYIILND